MGSSISSQTHSHISMTDIEKDCSMHWTNRPSVAALSADSSTSNVSDASDAAATRMRLLSAKIDGRAARSNWLEGGVAAFSDNELMRTCMPVTSASVELAMRLRVSRKPSMCQRVWIPTLKKLSTSYLWTSSKTLTLDGWLPLAETHNPAIVASIVGRLEELESEYWSMPRRPSGNEDTSEKPARPSIPPIPAGVPGGSGGICPGRGGAPG
mmetsp:Transcript_1871/g.4706  ORF Transcript_1871/g.4706 Transcript_1871/m.4706 type:complete len:211 (-) Transcript_1871:153-785(-)